MMQTLTLEQLRAAIGSGGVTGVTLKAQGGGFFVHIATRSGEDAILTKARSAEPRLFGNPAKALALLREIGIAVGAFDATDWIPDQKSQHRVRAGQAEHLRKAHAAVAYNKWLAKEIQDAIDDPRPVIPHAEVMAHMEAEIDAIEREQAKGQH